LDGLQNFIQGGTKVTGDGERKITEMRSLLGEFNDDLLAEQKTSKIMNKIWDTLNTEVMNLQIDTRKYTDKLDSAKHDYRVASSVMQSYTHEYQKKFAELEELNNTIKSREIARNKKMNQLQSIVIEGEESVAKVQQSILNYSKMGQSQMMSGRFSASSRREARSAEKKTSKEVKDKALANIVASIKEMKSRHDSKELRKQKLETMENDLSSNKDAMKERKATLEKELEKAIGRFDRLASNRQVYKEMDEQEIAIHNARKECDEWSIRDHNFNVSIDMLRSSLPRLLTKITRIQHPTPALEQLPDAIHKLEDEVGKLLKDTTSLLMREATAEDIAAANQAARQSGYADTSEIEKLERLPGFERLSKQIYYNLMTAHDASRDPENYNVRVSSVMNRDNSEGKLDSLMIGSPIQKGAKVRMQTNNMEDEIGSTYSSNIAGKAESEDVVGRLTASVDGSEFLDREKLKELSALIIERDAAKFGYTHLESTKKEKAKKAYKPKFISIT